MRNRALRLAVVVFLVAVISAAGVTLSAPGGKKGFQACPYPPCMAPCVLGAEPDVLCKTPDGIFKTTWACCCCGGGGNSFKFLK